MICPFCKEEIPDDVKVCPVCKESLKAPLKFNLKAATISVCVILALTLLSCVGVFAVNDTKSYEGVIPQHEIVSPEESNISGKTALNTLVKQHQDLNEYFNSKHSKENNSKVMAIFYENIDYYTNIFNNKIDIDVWTFSESGAGTHKRTFGNVDILGTVIIGKENGFDNTDYKDFKIVSPEVPFVRLVYVGEGAYAAVPNYLYLLETYSEKLTPDWEEYLNIKTEEQKTLKDEGYTIDGYLNVSMSDLKEWILTWLSFNNKYPNFKRNNEVKKLIYRYTYDFVTHDSLANESEIVGAAERKEYENLLSKLDKNSDIYKIVSGAYEILKAHNYKCGDDFWNYSTEISNRYNVNPRH